MEFESNLSEVTFGSSFKWKINNLIVADNCKYSVKSPKCFFKEANATWYVKCIVRGFYEGKVCVGFTFFLEDDQQDENIRYKFGVKNAKGKIVKSHFIEKRKSQKNELLKYDIGEDLAFPAYPDGNQFWVFCWMESLRVENPPSADDNDFKAAEDAPIKDLNGSVMASFTPLSSSAYEEKEETKEGETIDILSDDSSTDITESIIRSCDTSQSLNVTKDDESFTKLSKRIEAIYLIKMQQVAETSSSLLVLAARVKIFYLIL